MPKMYNCWKDDYSIDVHQTCNEHISYRFYRYYRSYYQTTAYNGAEWLVWPQADHRQKGSEAVGHWGGGGGDGEVGYSRILFWFSYLSLLYSKLIEPS